MVKISLKVLVVLLSVRWVSEDVETVKERTSDFWCRHAAQPFPALLRWACLLSASKCISLVIPAAALTVLVLAVGPDSGWTSGGSCGPKSLKRRDVARTLFGQ